MFRGILSIIFLITAGAVFFLLIQPLYNEIKELKVEKDSFDEALSNSKEIQKKRDELLLKYNSISQENLDRLNKIIPQQPGSMKFILEIENIAQKNGVILKNIDIKEIESTKEKVDFGGEVRLFEDIPFSMRLSGSYKSFYSFLKDIERNLRLTNINNISFSAGETDFYEFSVDGIFYWKK